MLNDSIGDASCKVLRSLPDATGCLQPALQAVNILLVHKFGLACRSQRVRIDSLVILMSKKIGGVLVDGGVCRLVGMISVQLMRYVLSLSKVATCVVERRRYAVADGADALR